MTMITDIDDYIFRHQNVIQALSEDIEFKKKILTIVDCLIDCFKKNKRLYLFGCGGSAADAQHIAAEFINKMNFYRPVLPAMALTTDTSILTAVGNDDEFSNIFRRQVEGLVTEGDVALRISTSGTSESVVRGLQTAKKQGAHTILFTGETIKTIPDCTDIVVNVPSNKTPHIQEAHILIAHMICTFVERELFNDVC